MTTFISTADARETSVELMEAILRVAGNNEAAANRIWSDGPSDAEQAAIIEVVTKNGMFETTDFCWGSAGYEWVN
jgi:hypothetical protein